MTNPTIDAMVDILAKSVAGIAESEDRGQLLEQTFNEFRAALAPEMEKMASDYVGYGLAKRDESLFKGLGTVGRVADLVGMVSDHIDDIKAGGSDGDDEEDMDPASDDVSEFLDHMLAFGELALRSSVNEHVDMTDPDDADEEIAKGMNIIAVPNAEAPEDDEAAILVKSWLPQELAQFATDPGGIHQMAVERAALLMLGAGVPEAALSKMFAGGTLAKADPTQDPTQDPSYDPSQDPSQDGQDDGQGGADGDDPLDVLGRLLAASMIQLDHIQQMIAGGGATPGVPDQAPAEDPAADPSADPAADPSQDPTMAKPPQKPVAKMESPEEAALAKRAADLEEKLAGTQDLLKKALAQPLAVKGMLHGNATLSKAADGNGSEDELSKFADELDRATTPEARSLLLSKAAFKFPGVDLRSLALSK